MERFYRGKYIIRFRENNEIKTITMSDKESCDYFVNMLENNGKQYIVIREIENGAKRDITALLDFEIK
ncbi:MAG: hypothetical protein MSA56_06045 [Clostridium sp.]|nr:hypothetical protein [Clostridium sp.]